MLGVAKEGLPPRYGTVVLSIEFTAVCRRGTNDSLAVPFILKFVCPAGYGLNQTNRALQLLVPTVLVFTGKISRDWSFAREQLPDAETRFVQLRLRTSRIATRHRGNLPTLDAVDVKEEQWLAPILR
jgi:hypothetical protein